MSDNVIRKTKKCRNGTRLLDQNSRQPLCTADYSFGENLMFVDPESETGCSYRMAFGSSTICSCPAHYALYNKHLWSNRPVMTDGEAQPGILLPLKGRDSLPKTAAEAVERLIDEMPLEDQVAIANMTADVVGELTIDLGHTIRNVFGLGKENKELLLSCSRESACEIEHPDDASAFILARLCMALIKTHKLKSVQDSNDGLHAISTAAWPAGEAPLPEGSSPWPDS